MPPFEPFFRNPHLATVAGNFWSRPQDEQRWPVESVIYRTEPEVQVMVHAQRPHTPLNGSTKGEILIVHGLEGSSLSGYARSMAYAALSHGYSACRFNLRGCGGTEHLALTSYHGGQTSDVLSVIRQRREESGQPVFLVGYSLGGNIVLKLAGELGDSAPDLLSGVCSVSAPIDLAACAAALERPENYLYQRRFVARLKERIRRRNRQDPELYTLKHLHKIRTIVDFDTFYTAHLFGFGTAANYFRTQSSGQFLDRIRIPALLVQAQDDPLIPFSIYNHPAFASNKHLQLITAAHGGHVGFISRRRPRFWVDEVVLDWVEEMEQDRANARILKKVAQTP